MAKKHTSEEAMHKALEYIDFEEIKEHDGQDEKRFRPTGKGQKIVPKLHTQPTYPKPKVSIERLKQAGSPILLTFAEGVLPDALSAYSLSVLREVLRRAGEEKGHVLRTHQSLEAHTLTLYQRLETRGVGTQRALYGQGGNKVIDVYVQGKAKQWPPEDIQAHMQATTVAYGSTRVAKYCTDPNELQLVLLDTTPLTNPETVKTILTKDTRIARVEFVDLYAAYFIALPQPKEPAA